MLTQNDRNAIRQMIQEELRLALFRTITIERGPRQQGDPEKVIKEEQWNVLDFLAVYAPRIEAALRGMQEDVDKTKNAVAVSAMKVEAVGKILLGLEQSALRLVATGDEAKRLGFGALDLSFLTDQSDPTDLAAIALAKAAPSDAVGPSDLSAVIVADSPQKGAQK